AKLIDTAQLAQLVDDAVRGSLVEFAGVGFGQLADIASVLDARRLHAQADAEVGNLLLARIADRVQHSRYAALAESTRDEDAVESFELRFKAFALEAFRFHPDKIQFQIVRQRSMDQRLFE